MKITMKLHAFTKQFKFLTNAYLLNDEWKNSGLTKANIWKEVGEKKSTSSPLGRNSTKNLGGFIRKWSSPICPPFEFFGSHVYMAFVQRIQGKGTDGFLFAKKDDPFSKQNSLLFTLHGKKYQVEFDLVSEDDAKLPSISSHFQNKE